MIEVPNIYWFFTEGSRSHLIVLNWGYWRKSLISPPSHQTRRITTFYVQDLYLEATGPLAMLEKFSLGEERRKEMAFLLLRPKTSQLRDGRKGWQEIVRWWKPSPGLRKWEKYCCQTHQPGKHSSLLWNLGKPAIMKCPGSRVRRRGQQESVRRKIGFNRQHFFPEYKQGNSVMQKSPLKHLFYYNVRDVIGLAETGISSE